MKPFACLRFGARDSFVPFPVVCVCVDVGVCVGFGVVSGGTAAAILGRHLPSSRARALC